MDSSIISGKQKPNKGYSLRRVSAEKRSKQRGRATNHDHKDGRKYRHDHPAHPHEHDIPNHKG